MQRHQMVVVVGVRTRFNPVRNCGDAYFGRCTWECTFKEKSMKIRFKKLHPEAKSPFKAHATDAGFDLTCTSATEDRRHNCVSYGTGIAVEIPRGYVGLVFPRSSVYKEDIDLTNCVGVIDSGYRGEIMAKFRILQPHIHRYTTGDRIAQLIVLPYPEIEFEEAEELDESDRGTGGYGSSGR